MLENVGCLGLVFPVDILPTDGTQTGVCHPLQNDPIDSRMGKTTSFELDLIQLELLGISVVCQSNYANRSLSPFFLSNSPSWNFFCFFTLRKP